MLQRELEFLAGYLDGELQTDGLTRTIYSTDASAYQEEPIAVAFPKSEKDLQELIKFANRHAVGLIPRTAGTSLAGQVVGSGIIVDVSRHLNRILEVHKASDGDSWVRVQPGVIRNELNQHLADFELLFGPETSTQNRAMLGGMLGNNSCGSNSIKYGSVRDHIVEVTVLLSDGTKATFSELDRGEFDAKCDGPETAETRLYRDMREWLSDPAIRSEITREFPKASIPRRNTGYAVDALMDASCFVESSQQPFNFAKLVAGSEGTLCIVLEMKLRCSPLPPPVTGLQCAQFETVNEALRATQLAVKYDCYAVEIIDHFILDCTKRSIAHRDNRFFLEGEPGAVLVTEIRGESEDSVRSVMTQIEADFRAANLGYAYPVLFGDDTKRIWDLRKAGLGLLSNEPGDVKPVPVIEDTAVDVEDLAQYIAEFDDRLQQQFGLQCVHYAHAGSGEIHLRPYINLKTSEGNQQFREVAQEIATLVKKYRGSLSGEHGDGRLRGEFIEQMVGPKNYQLFKDIKQSWDPNNIFNPNKIVDTPAMNTSLRYEPDQSTPELPTVFDWSETQGIIRAAEMCNGSGDCRKTHLAGGTMCPSYMATRNEKDTTRARANTLRNVLTNSAKENRFDDDDLKEVLDLCLSCKGCKNECPSTVDMAKLKAEFQQHYYDANPAPLRSRLIANFVNSQKWTSKFPWLWNFVFKSPLLRPLANRIAGFHPDRSIPLAPRKTFEQWSNKRGSENSNSGRVFHLVLLNDEFTNYIDASIGEHVVLLLEALGYQVRIETLESGRTWLSKGFVRKAQSILQQNVDRLASLVSEDCPLVGIEPSAILTFRDEALDLMDQARKGAAQALAANTFTFEEFIAREFAQGRISSNSFTSDKRQVLVHGHCFQKALSGVAPVVEALSVPSNFEVQPIQSGCCGMAGSFGYEKEHYELSMQIGELVLMPTIRASDPNTIIAASGTSCRHQISDGTGRRARHTAEILYESLEQNAQ